MLNEVLTRLETVGMRLKKEKCIFMALEVVYLGHRISKDGLQPTEEKVKAVTETPQATNVSELRAFLGLVNYYGKFMQNLSTLLAPLYALLQKKVPWEWREEEQEAFEALLKSPKLLAHYDSNRVDSDMQRITIWARCSARTQDGRWIGIMHHEH